MIVQTGVKFNAEYGIEAPPNLRVYDVPDTYTVEKLVSAVEREHIRQLIQQVTGCKFNNEHLDVMQQITTILVATFKKEKLEQRNDMSIKDINTDIDKDKARLLAGIANSDVIPKIMSNLLTKIEREAILGNYSLRETFLLTDLDKPVIKVIEHKIKKLGFTFEVEQTNDCKDYVVIGWE